jgi:hypothetical protein
MMLPFIVLEAKTLGSPTDRRRNRTGEVFVAGNYATYVW